MIGAQARIRGLYAVTPDVAETKSLLDMVTPALHGGARIVQYRNKQAGKDLSLEQATALRSLTRAFDALLIVNDDPALALEIGADGVHLGREDFANQTEADRLASIRRQAEAAGNPSLLIGVSCYADLALAERAVAATADYVAFGSAFPSQTKPGATQTSTAIFSQAKRNLSLPIVAIGGITPENAPELIAAGANAIAVISSLFGAEDIQAQAVTFNTLFARNV